MKTLNRSQVLFGLAGVLLLVTLTACSKSPTANNAANTSRSDAEIVGNVHQRSGRTGTGQHEMDEDEKHGHVPGAHGGIIVSLGRDSYHVEAIVTSAGELQLYTLGNDETRVIDIEAQDLTAYVKSPTGTESTSITVKPQPQPGDGTGKASLFTGQVPEAFKGQAVNVTIPNMTIAGERFRLGFTTESAEHGLEGMPAKVGNAAERELYLTPGGVYTQADIEANGNVTASEKFQGFMAAHDLNPKVGDKICPVTLTKANASCSWIVGGKTYEFCCPPCVDEFVTLAKTKPDEVKSPEEYVKK